MRRDEDGDGGKGRCGKPPSDHKPAGNGHVEASAGHLTRQDGAGHGHQARRQPRAGGKPGGKQARPGGMLQWGG
jgi:hypothetical protein